jgi:hypothetical protein
LDQFCPWTPTGKFCLSFTQKKETWSVTKSHHFFVFVFSTNKNFWTNSTVFLLHQIWIVKYWTVDCKYVFTFSTRFFLSIIWWNIWQSRKTHLIRMFSSLP